MLGQSTGFSSQGDASMKALPKRKGNNEIWCGKEPLEITSMKVPIEKRRNLAMDSPPRPCRTSMKVYTSSCRTNGPVVIRGGILICLIESPHKLMEIVFQISGRTSR